MITRKEAKKQEWKVPKAHIATDDLTQLGTGGLMLDSGAYSAWRQDFEIDVKVYTEFVLEHQDGLECMVNLDVIPRGYASGRVSMRECERACKVGWDNYQYMLSKGVDAQKLIHVFHQGDSFEWLKRYVDAKIPYIGLSPRGIGTALGPVYEWLTECMEYALDAEGFPVQKWHGFGVSGFKLMRSFPWYSVDSTLAGIQTGIGRIIMPPLVDGERCYTEHPFFVATSLHGGQWQSMPPCAPKEVERQCRLYLEEKGYPLGKSTRDPETGQETVLEEGVTNNSLLRMSLNVQYMVDLSNSLPDWPWAYKRLNREEALF